MTLELNNGNITLNIITEEMHDNIYFSKELQNI